VKWPKDKGDLMAGDLQSLPVSVVAEQLRSLGIAPGIVLLVHTSYRAIRPIQGGPPGVIQVLQEVLGPNGTLVMPAMAGDDDHLFDPLSTSAMEMGIVADTFWRQPGVLRSDNPSSFAASDPAAATITAPHAMPWPDHGPGTPVGRVYDLDGWVLLLGIDHTANTTIHLAEHLGDVRYRRPKYTTILINGRPQRHDYFEIDHCCQRFSLADEWLSARQLQREGMVGHGIARLMRSRDVVSVVVEHLQVDPTIFLHAYGFDLECDEARRSLERDL
jgi:aminoglycoside 3-N-acetyltransferase